MAHEGIHLPILSYGDDLQDPGTAEPVSATPQPAAVDAVVAQEQPPGGPSTAAPHQQQRSTPQHLQPSQQHQEQPDGQQRRAGGAQTQRPEGRGEQQQTQQRPLPQQSTQAKLQELARLRKRRVFICMLRLLDKGARDAAQLSRLTEQLTGEEFMQVTEERALAGKCGNPLCANPHRAPSAAAAYRRVGPEVVRSGPEHFCGAACRAFAEQVAATLGDEAAKAPAPPPGPADKILFRPASHRPGGGGGGAPAVAAQGGGVATMLADVQERPAASGAAAVAPAAPSGSGGPPGGSVEGYVPRTVAPKEQQQQEKQEEEQRQRQQPKEEQQPQQQPKGEAGGQPQQPDPQDGAAAAKKSVRFGPSVEYREDPAKAPPEAPVLCFTLEGALQGGGGGAGGAQADGAAQLGDAFGSLRVVDASELAEGEREAAAKAAAAAAAAGKPPADAASKSVVERSGGAVSSSGGGDGASGGGDGGADGATEEAAGVQEAMRMWFPPSAGGWGVPVQAVAAPPKKPAPVWKAAAEPIGPATFGGVAGTAAEGVAAGASATLPKPATSDKVRAAFAAASGSAASSRRTSETGGGEGQEDGLQLPLRPQLPRQPLRFKPTVPPRRKVILLDALPGVSPSARSPLQRGAAAAAAAAAGGAGAPAQQAAGGAVSSGAGGPSGESAAEAAAGAQAAAGRTPAEGGNAPERELRCPDEKEDEPSAKEEEEEDEEEEDEDQEEWGYDESGEPVRLRAPAAAQPPAPRRPPQGWPARPAPIGAAAAAVPSGAGQRFSGGFGDDDSGSDAESLGTRSSLSSDGGGGSDDDISGSSEEEGEEAEGGNGSSSRRRRGGDLPLEAGPSSDEDDDGSGGDFGLGAAVPFFGAPKGGVRAQLPEFGAMWSLVNQLVTDRTRAYLQEGAPVASASDNGAEGGSGSISEAPHPSQGEPPAESAAAAQAAAAAAAIAAGADDAGAGGAPPSLAMVQVRLALSEMLGGALPPVLAALRIRVPASEVSKQLSALVCTFALNRPLPGLAQRQWRLVVALLLAGLSWRRLPLLRPLFLRGRPAPELLELLADLGQDGDRFFALLELLHADL